MAEQHAPTDVRVGEMGAGHAIASQLDKLSGGKSGFYEAHHVTAAQKMAIWGERAQLRQRVTMSYDPAQVGGRRGGGDRSGIADMAIEARKAIARLYTQLPRDCAEILIDVFVYEKGLQTIETERGWPRRSAKLVLRIGLDRLAQVLGLEETAVGQASSKPQRWRSETFQPARFE